MKTRTFHQDIYISIILFIILGIAFMTTINLNVDSARFPKLIIAGLAVLNGVMLVGGIKETKDMNIKGKEVINEIKWKTIKWPLIVLLACVGYIILFRFINYFVATTVFMISLMKLYKVKSWKVIILVTLFFNLIVYLGFVKALNVPLI